MEGHNLKKCEESGEELLYFCHAAVGCKVPSHTEIYSQEPSHSANCLFNFLSS